MKRILLITVLFFVYYNTFTFAQTNCALSKAITTLIANDNASSQNNAGLIADGQKSSFWLSLNNGTQTNHGVKITMGICGVNSISIYWYGSIPSSFTMQLFDVSGASSSLLNKSQFVNNVIGNVSTYSFPSTAVAFTAVLTILSNQVGVYEVELIGNPATISYSSVSTGGRQTRQFNLAVTSLKSAQISSDSSYVSSKTKLAEATDNKDKIHPVLNTIDNLISVYPNPTKGELIVRFSSMNSSEQPSACIQLWDINGRVLKRINQMMDNNTLDMSELSNGIYIVKVSMGGQTKEWKIVKD